MHLPSLIENHDLNLPPWGPYAKTYAGISHIPFDRLNDTELNAAFTVNTALSKGARMDFSLFPSFYRRKLELPNVNWESNYHPLSADADLREFAYRFQLEWKDVVTTDIVYRTPENRFAKENIRSFSAIFRNNSSAEQSLALNLIAGLHWPCIHPRSDIELRPAVWNLPRSGVWINLPAASELEYAQTGPRDSLVYDALQRGQGFDHGFTDGTYLRLGRNSGDFCRFALPSGIADTAALFIRCRRDPASEETTTSLSLNGESLTIDFGSLGLYRVPAEISRLGGAGVLTYCSGPAVDIDGLLIADESTAAGIEFTTTSLPDMPRVVSLSPSRLEIRYPEISDCGYIIDFDGSHPNIRLVTGHDLDSIMRRTVHDHVNPVLSARWRETGPDQGKPWTYAQIAPLALGPGEERSLSGKLAFFNGEQEREKIIAQLDGQRASKIPAHRYRPEPSEGDTAKYLFGRERLAAVMLTNIVFPIAAKGNFIRHFTPGKWWDSLYTWDSGFTALGLLEISRDRAIECLNAYLTEPEDKECAFVHHGSMVPVQFYVFWELWSLSQDTQLLRYFYRRLRNYYLFYTGRLGSSTTARFTRGLLNTWDYFYNSGGWDDYPAQEYVHDHALENNAAPIVVTAHAIRIAKIMLKANRLLGDSISEEGDTAIYREDIRRFTEILNTYAWDPEVGYYGYLTHDEYGRPAGILRSEDGENLNRGMDGVTPLYAGAVPDGAELAMLLDNVHSREGLMTPIGLTTVDQRASYYSKSGYWNGAVWMPHQWFIWKACFDLSDGDFAWSIARTALDLWQHEVGESFGCFEHFIVETGRGAGWHHFGGLSAPILNWFAAYYHPGRVTGGFNCTITKHEYDEKLSRMVCRFEYRNEGACRRSKGGTIDSRDENVRGQLLVSMPPNGEYTWRLNGKRTTPIRRCGDSAWLIDVYGEGELICESTRN